MLYYKIINDKTVISDCKTLYIESENSWVSNPSQEQIFHEGWQVYTPPPTPPQTEPYDSEVIAAVKKMLSSSVESLTDEEALEVAALYPTWASKIGKEVYAGEHADRLWYNEKLYKVLQQHIVSEEWTPDTAVSLYVEVSVEEWPEIPENISAENPWMSGDKGTWKGQHYICRMDNCVWNPDQYPAAWSIAD